MKDIIVFRSTERGNHSWDVYDREGVITLQPRRVLKPTDKLFVMGSCFSILIRTALEKATLKCTPDYESIPIDGSRMRIEGYDRPYFHINYFNTYTVLQEMHRCLGLWTQADDDYWHIDRNPWQQDHPGETQSWQDPYRRLQMGRTLADIQELNAHINKVTFVGFKEANAFLFTFDTTEVFKQSHNGLAVGERARFFKNDGLGGTTLHQTTFAENYANVEQIIQLLQKHKPGCPIIFAVSPVPIGTTFAGGDVVVANMESKAVLRAVLGEIARAYPDVIYFPAYEMAAHQSPFIAFNKDGRHIRLELSEMMTQAFIYNHYDIPGMPAPVPFPQQDIG
ncbi:MAG: GSCFA domain-containing protein [Bdellovibrionales bacterium]